MVCSPLVNNYALFPTSDVYASPDAIGTKYNSQKTPKNSWPWHSFVVFKKQLHYVNESVCDGSALKGDVTGKCFVATKRKNC